MAPKKRTRGATARNRDKSRRLTQRRSNDLPTIYKCLNRLCGEECNQELIPVNESRASHNSRTKPSDEPASDVSDEIFETDRRVRKDISKATRVTKLKLPDYDPELRMSFFEFEMKKTKNYLFEALQFGVNSGLLTKKDDKGKLLRVASEIIEESEQSQPQESSHSERVPKNQGRYCSNTTYTHRFRDYDPRNFSARPQMDEEGEKQKTAAKDRPRLTGHSSSRKRVSRGRSRSNVRKGSKRRLPTTARSRSHSRRSNRRRSTRSRSVHPSSDPRAKPPTGDDKPLEDMIHDSGKEASRNIDDNEDGEEAATKAPKSSKSSPSIGKQTAEGKKQRSEEKQDNSEDSEDDDKQKK